MNKTAPLIVVLGFLASSTMAQDMPYVDAVGAYSHANIMSPPADEATHTRPAMERKPQSLRSSISQAHMDKIIAQLQTEYDRRIAVDGKPSADEWLKHAVRDLEKRYKQVK